MSSSKSITVINEMLDLAVSSSMSTLGTILESKINTNCNNNKTEIINNIDFTSIEPAMFLNIAFSGDTQFKATAFFRIIDLSVILNFMTNSENDNTEFDEMSLGMLNEIMTQIFTEFSKKLSENLKLDINASVSGLIKFKDLNNISSFFECENDSEILSKSFQYEINSVIKGFSVLYFNSQFIDSLLYENVTESNSESQLKTENNKTTIQDEYTKPNINAKKSKFKLDNEIQIHKPEFPKFSNNASDELSRIVGGNLDLLMDVPVSVCVEIGKTRRKMKEVMNYTQGSVILLDKRTGDSVDITVNGQIIARGDVVVIDDNFGVRITEIVNSKEVADRP